MSLAMLVLLAVQSPQATVGDWEWDASTPICTLRQTTPSLETIEIARTPANDETALKIITRSRGKVREGQFHDASIDLYPVGKALADGSLGKTGKGLTVFAVTPDPTFIRYLSGASALAISSEKAKPVRIEVRSATTAIQALRECEDRKMRAWGIDPVAWRALKSKPFPLAPVRDRFSALDYPGEALRAGVEFDAIIRLDVGRDGSVEQCRGLNPGDYRGFEVASCAVLKGAKFRPALDAAGSPVSAPFIFDVRFRISD
jgi:TonB family protein